MNLKQPFFKLPIKMEVESAALEVVQKLNEADWLDHPSNFKKNSYVPILSHQGTLNNLKRTPVMPTLPSKRLPAVTRLLRFFNFRIGIARLMRLGAGYEVPVHSDTNEYWDKRVRIHIPLVTSKSVFFTCDGTEVVMAPGEVWTFDNWRRHGVRNEGTESRIHLVFDTEATNIFDDNGNLKTVLSEIKEQPELKLEDAVSPAIKSGAQLDETLGLIVKELELCNDKEEADAWIRLIQTHGDRWKTIESSFGVDVQAMAYYKKAINDALQEAEKLGDSLRLKVNNAKVISLFKARVVNGMNLQMLFNHAK
ncbi:aspartyl/asparaginyl beta-hydroxylase domain-containing protein [Roseivirga sp. E12]|uniref:aspartyl/asparaginyl beta-hydroxylase domain-containing protein n=1 Tax=Roseivirga sp. E12 TaxID=2819237 RepID=UPI001ABCF134|nr:aspartyl/asparaginyl beta-hydroxylase domain-containing protein [Roseivirga sp. E12]MBO3699053.1 aspartyl/asparaginyl beta-hydroxylase domain-containing protein [Roseivirga sp. E12]